MAGVVFMTYKQKSQSADWLKFIGSGIKNKTNFFYMQKLNQYNMVCQIYLSNKELKIL